MIHTRSGLPGIRSPAAPVSVFRRAAGRPGRPGAIVAVMTVCVAALACGSPEAEDHAEPIDTTSASGPARPDGAPAANPAAPADTGSAPVAGGQPQRDAGRLAQPLEAALREMLKGPSDSARAAGTHSWFSDTTAGALRSVTVDGAGGAIVDFADLRRLIPNASTSAGSGMLLRELNATVFAVPEIQRVEYRIEGSCEAFWEWLQYGGCQVQRRP